MRWFGRFAGKPGKADELSARTEQVEVRDGAAGDPELEEALKNFRMSFHALSDAAYCRPRTVAQVVRHSNWRLAAGCALAGVLVAGGVSGSFYERHQRLESARIAAAAHAAEQQRLASEKQGLVQDRPIGDDEEDLLATVDRDVSRQVPSAMEPLAQLMDDQAK